MPPFRRDAAYLCVSSETQAWRRRFFIANKARRKQDKANADLPTGVYIDVHKQGKTQVQRSIA